MVDTMNEYVKKLTNDLEPLIYDLDDKLMELELKKEKLESVSRMLAYVNGDVNMVGVYADQDLIIDSLEKINSNKDEYRASCYLLRNEDENIKNLPQYREANLYILGLINYFKMFKGELSSEIQELERVCREKEVDKKYYQLLNENTPLIENVTEFADFIEKHLTTDEERINLLKFAINSNLTNYQEQNI